MKDLEKENQRLRRALSDLTLDKLTLQEAAKGTCRTLRGGAASTMCDESFRSGYPGDGYAVCRDTIDRPGARCRAGRMTNRR